jgi:pimeloyl-ACP methyl ester carboxylesterase
MEGRPSYRTESVVSQDGTVIAYRVLGNGPGVILLHGGMKASQHFMRLAALLAETFTVYVPDRRGRGRSGPIGEHDSVDTAVADLEAILERSGAENLFGLSTGALIALRTAKACLAVRRLALYEPPLSVRGSVSTAWISRFDREIARGRVAAAVITALKGLQGDPVFAKVPRFLLTPFMTVAFRFVDRPSGDDVSMRALVPTMHFDVEIVMAMADTSAEYAALPAEVLLMEGTRSPSYLHQALDVLQRILPRCRRVTFTGLGHDGPEDDGQPARVGDELLRFFRQDEPRADGEEPGPAAHA